MAKKRPKSVAKTTDSNAKDTIFSLKASPEWGEWFSGFAMKMRDTKAGLVDRALTEMAKRNGYPEPPNR